MCIVPFGLGFSLPYSNKMITMNVDLNINELLNP